MAVDKLVDSTQLDTDLTSVANAIRTKGGTQGQLAFPNGFVTAIQNIPTGGTTPTGTINIDDDGTYNVTDYATAEVAIDYPSKVREVTFNISRDSAAASSAVAFTIYSSMNFSGGIKQTTKIVAIAAGETTNTTTVYVPKQRPIFVIGVAAAVGNYSVTIDSSHGECVDAPHILGASSTNITKAIYVKAGAPDQFTITVNLNSQAAYPDTAVLSTLSVTQNGTYTAAAGTAYSSVEVNVPTGGVSVTQDANGFIVIPPTGSGGGGGGTSATQHIIHLEFSDTTDTDIDVYYDDALISTMITAYEPTTYGGKTVTLAQLDNVTWYEPTSIPLNTQLVDYSKATANAAIDSQGDAVSTQWYYASDYTPVARGMAFNYKSSLWHYIAFYDSSKAFISSIYVYTDGTADPSDSNTGNGTLSGNKIPTTAAYVRLCGTGADSSHISLIRTA